MVLLRQPQRPPRRGLHPSPCRPRTPTGLARGTVRLPPMRRLRLAPQRHLCPRPGGPGAPAAGRNRSPTAPGLPGAGDVPVCAQRPFPGLVRILDLLGCGVGAATLWQDVQAVAPGRMPDPQATLPPWVEVDETWLSIDGEKRPVAVVLGPKGERQDLRLSGPGFDWGGWFTVLAARGVQGVTTDDDPVYGPALDASGLDRQQCAVHMQRTVGRHIRGLDEDALTHLDRVLLPILQRRARARPVAVGPVLLELWQAVAQGRVRLDPEVRKRLWHLVVRWHDLVAQSTQPESVRLHQPAGGLVWPLQAPGPPDAGVEDRGRRPPLRGSDGPRHGLKRHRQPPTGAQDAHDGPQPISTRLKLCQIRR